ncbi:helix-hairpin-helix domain-containing protein [Pokkaliibacter sp. MBI-7]|uniref:ComEA family DNA-binding protein n=1 Tax=Pokkaliibacter sp. MBI-7 TaxID=3040600 RepID=UPI0024490659|nr:helix-hairpin-helix domain-containing protein [Pokkaliibacter sp. MBI-7]MDH2436143.1 helix-hairpin-helix domain-containing protein [Pokkaliibacter sp. MBI-7]
MTLMTNPLQNIVRIAEPFGYQFSGDVVVLNCTLECDVPLAEGWSLRLLAVATEPQADVSMVSRGIQIASATLGALAYGSLDWQQNVEAAPPAGSQSYQLVLQLVSPEGDAVQECPFAQLQRFVQPSLQGQCDCFTKDGQRFLQVATVANPREAENLSGSLSLELWQLEAPYNGGSFTGELLVQRSLGCLGGGQEWQNVTLQLEPSQASLPYQYLMLREWTAQGYITRDYLVAPAFASTAVEVDADAEVTTTVEATEVAQPDSTDIQVKEDAVEMAPAPVAEVAETPEPAIEQVVRKTVASSKKKAVVADKPKAQPELCSINTAGPAALTRVKGISPRLANDIVRNRPYQKLDDLLKVKGIGVKVLERIAPYLCV